MTWTPDRTERLKALWAEGRSSSQIAKELGGLTRNAVIGKVKRLIAEGEIKPNEIQKGNRMAVDDTPNLHSIPSKHDELQGAVEAMRRALPAYLELAALNAQVRRSHYDAYIAQGFTETQALILCQKVTL